MTRSFSSCYQSGPSRGAGIQQPHRVAQAPQSKNRGFSTPGMFNSVPEELPMDYWSQVPNPPATNDPQARASTMSELVEEPQAFEGILPMSNHLPHDGVFRGFEVSTSSNDQAPGVPEPNPPDLNGQQFNNLLLLDGIDYDDTFDVPKTSTDQAPGCSEPNPPAVNGQQFNNPFISSFLNYEEVDFDQQGTNRNSTGPQGPAQASRSTISESFSLQNRLRLQSSGPGPQSFGSAYYQSNHQAPQPGLQIPGYEQCPQSSSLPPGPLDGNQLWGSEANAAQFIMTQFPASQTQFPRAVPSNATNVYGNQAPGQQVVHPRNPASQSISSSARPIGAFSRNIWRERSRRLVPAQVPHLAVAQGQGVSENISQNFNNLDNVNMLQNPNGLVSLDISQSSNSQDSMNMSQASNSQDSMNMPQNSNNQDPVPELPRPPRDNQGQGEAPISRYCVDCRMEVASLAVPCEFCHGMMIWAGLPELRFCKYCMKPASAPNSIVCPKHEKRAIGLSSDEKKALERAGICKRCYKFDAWVGFLKCERCLSDQRRYGATSRENRAKRGICINCSSSVDDPEFRNCGTCRQKKAEGSKQARQKARRKNDDDGTE